MSINYSVLVEQLYQEKAKRLDESCSSKKMLSLRNGLNISKSDFWQDLITMCGNAEGLSEILGVPSEKIRSWPDKIRAGLEEIKEIDNNNTKLKTKNQMLATGDF